MTWTVQLLHEGVPVIDPVPAHPYVVAEILAGVAVALWGGPVSVVRAVVDAEPKPPVEQTLFSEEAA